MRVKRPLNILNKPVTLLADLDMQDPAYKPLEELMAQAEFEFEIGSVNESTNDPDLSQSAKSTRAFTRAQVRALQVIQALRPVPETPADFGM